LEALGKALHLYQGGHHIQVDSTVDCRRFAGCYHCRGRLSSGQPGAIRQGGTTPGLQAKPGVVYD
jgi:hypothetical protein